MLSQLTVLLYLIMYMLMFTAAIALRYRMPKADRKLAMRSALSAKLADGELVLVDDYGFEKPSTKAAVAMLKAGQRGGCEGLFGEALQ